MDRDERLHALVDAVYRACPPELLQEAHELEDRWDSTETTRSRDGNRLFGKNHENYPVGVRTAVDISDPLHPVVRCDCGRTDCPHGFSRMLHRARWPVHFSPEKVAKPKKPAAAPAEKDVEALEALAADLVGGAWSKQGKVAEQHAKVIDKGPFK